MIVQNLIYFIYAVDHSRHAHALTRTRNTKTYRLNIGKPFLTFQECAKQPTICKVLSFNLCYISICKTLIA